MGAEAPSDALPWLRLHIPQAWPPPGPMGAGLCSVAHLNLRNIFQEEYDTLATLFYSFCTPSGIMTLAEAQRLLQYMNYHDAVVCATRVLQRGQ